MERKKSPYLNHLNRKSRKRQKEYNKKILKNVLATFAEMLFFSGAIFFLMVLFLTNLFRG